MLKKLSFILALLFPLALSGQTVPGPVMKAFRQDTLSFRIEYPAGGTEVDLAYGSNARAWESFREEWRSLSADGRAVLETVLIRTGVTLDGSASLNLQVSDLRAMEVQRFLTAQLGPLPAFVHINRGVENWEQLGSMVAGLSPAAFRWRDDVLGMLYSPEESRFTGDERSVSQLRTLDGGQPWRYLMENVYPVMRSTEVSAVVSVPVAVAEDALREYGQLIVRDTVYRTRLVRDTLLVGDLGYDSKYSGRVKGRKLIGAVRTNILAVPLANVGFEFPFTEHFSVAADIYYPWIWRNSLHRDCTEMLAYGVEFRYWPGRDGVPPEARLLGHSFGVYGAGGHFDFERNWEGYQGTFFNVGVDWMYALPVFHGKMHLEFEVGLGMIYSQSQPYNCFFEYGECIRQTGVTKIVRWFGPTRAQVSLVVPVYVKGRRAGR